MIRVKFWKYGLIKWFIVVFFVELYPRCQVGNWAGKGCMSLLQELHLEKRVLMSWDVVFRHFVVFFICICQRRRHYSVILQHIKESAFFRFVNLVILITGKLYFSVFCVISSVVNDIGTFINITDTGLSLGFWYVWNGILWSV